MLNVIAELAADVFDNIHQQQPQPGAARPLKLEKVLEAPLCPDWPRERVAVLAATRRVWYATDLLTEDSGIPPGDAVFILLHPGMLPAADLQRFLVVGGTRAIDYAETVVGRPLVPAGTPWADATKALTAQAAAMASATPAAPEISSWRVLRAGRVCGLVELGLRSANKTLSSAAIQASGLLYQTCPEGAQAELAAQVATLRALTAP